MSEISAISVFVHDALSAGKSRAEIRSVLLTAGWEPEEADKALAEFADSDFGIPVPRKRTHLYARDTFLHLIEFLTLTISAIGLGTLLFQFVNLLFPDPLRQQDWAIDSVYSTLRFAASALIIAFPVFVWVTRLLRRTYREDVERRASPVRKWLTYLQMFFAVALVIAYLITLVNHLLDGSLSISFAVKVLIVLGTAAMVFRYYLPGLRQEERPDSDVVLKTA